MINTMYVAYIESIHGRTYFMADGRAHTPQILRFGILTKDFLVVL